MSKSAPLLLAAAGAIGSAVVVGVIAALGGRGTATGDGAPLTDQEAIARMLASENPSGGARLWVEQIWTQIRASGGRSLAQTITGGMGYGVQLGARPVSTAEPATQQTRAFAAAFLASRPTSTLDGARRFFEPAQQDRAFAIGESGRRKKAAGLPLSQQEQRLIFYKSNASGIRARWTAKSHRYVGTIEGVEFWT